MKTNDRTFRLSVSTTKLEAFRDACEAASWYVVDTGERIMTDDGPDGEAVLLVQAQVTPSSRAATALIH